MRPKAKLRFSIVSLFLVRALKTCLLNIFVCLFVSGVKIKGKKEIEIKKLKRQNDRKKKELVWGF